MGTLSSYAHVATLAGTERVPVVVTPGIAGGNAYITATEMAAALALLNTTAWTGVTFANSWVNFGAANQNAQYRKVGDTVQVRGMMKSGTVGAAAFTLPAGFRPPADLVFATWSNSAFGTITLDSAGVFTPLAGSNVSFAVNCMFSTVA